MRILARTAIAFSAAIFAANYLLPQSWLLYAAVLSALMAAGLTLPIQLGDYPAVQIWLERVD